ncbi:hypothetical protein CsatB_027331 [Cannabis sativa]
MMMEGGETSDTRMKDLDSADDGFTQTVFSWTLEDISNENLYKVFSLAEFAVITGLLCNGDNDMKKYAKRENAFVDKYFFEQQVTHGAVEQRFMFSGFKSDEYAVKMAILYLLTNGLICSPAVKKVFDELMNIGSICQYDASEEYRICRWSSTGNPNSGELDRKIFMSSKLKAQAILPTDVERKMMKLESFDFPVVETSKDDFDDEPLERKHYEKGDPSSIQRSYGVGKSDLVELRNNVKMLVVSDEDTFNMNDDDIVLTNEEELVLEVILKVADDKVIYDETKECTVAVTKKLGDSQGTEDSITLFALEKINDIEEKIAKGKVLHNEIMAPNQRNNAKGLTVDFTSKVVKRPAKPGSVMKSPYTTNFGSASSGKPTGEVYGLFPFSNGLMVMPDELQVKSFEQWFNVGFNDKNKLKKFKQEYRVLKVLLNFVVVKVNDKIWFYDLRTSGRNLSYSFTIVLTVILILFFCSDCGIFVIKYAEYFIHEMINNVPKTLNMDFVRKKMCVELFVHAMKKELNGYESGSAFTRKMPKATRGALKIG